MYLGNEQQASFLKLWSYGLDRRASVSLVPPIGRGWALMSWRGSANRVFWSFIHQLEEYVTMKWLTGFLAAAFLAAMLIAVPSGCGKEKATEIDTSTVETPKYPADYEQKKKEQEEQMRKQFQGR